MKAGFSGLLISIALLAGAPAVLAADTAPSRTTAPDKLGSVRAHIAEKRWQAAVDELKALNDTGNADWNNLMGYSLRKLGVPDYGEAEKFYAEALRIDPKHRGALEYSGELYLMTGNLPKAEERLATLDKVCKFSCEEYRDLKRSVERYKAAGNKYVAAP
jgi:tetratricopeptide (TPR) repeat protein